MPGEYQLDHWTPGQEQARHSPSADLSSTEQRQLSIRRRLRGVAS